MSLTINIKGNPIKLLDRSQLMLFNQKTNKLDTWILDTFFPNKVGLPLTDVENERKVFIGDLETNSPIAPLVAPSVQGRMITEQAQYNAKYVTPPYVKPSSPLVPSRVTEIALLQTLTDAGVIRNIDNMSGAEKYRVAQIRQFMKRQESISNFKTLQAMDILTKGKTTFKSADFPELTVDYDRHAAMTYMPSTKWDDANATPIDDINDMLDLMNEHEGVTAGIALTSSAVIAKLKKNPQFKEEFVTAKGVNAANPIESQFIKADKPQYWGNVGGIQFWSYDKKYKAVDGSMKRYIDEKAFYLIADTSGYQASCGLLNFDVLNQPLEYYDYHVEQKDPSVHKFITEASPLIVPSMRNGVVGGLGFLT